jgi:hypothetical protein
MVVADMDLGGGVFLGGDMDLLSRCCIDGAT